MKNENLLKNLSKADLTDEPDLLKELKSLLPWLLAAGIVVAGYYGVKNYLAAKRAAASEALVSSYTTEEIEEAVSKHGSAKVGGALKLRLAKKYYDAARYQEALDLYAEAAKAPADGFADVPAVGQAQCLEALGKIAEARKAYEDFAAANPKSCLALAAKIGAARTAALAGERDKALAALKALKDEVGSDMLGKMRVEAAEDCVKRIAVKK